MLNKSKLSEPLELGYVEEVFKTVKALELDSTLIEWDDFCMLMQRFISATSLTASSNGFGKLSTPFINSSLASLTLEYNEFTSLTDLEVLTQLSSLESLLLKGNKIYTAGTMTETGAIKTFTPLIFNKKLSYIDLSSNKINDWGFIDELIHVFPGMTSLRLSTNPLYPESSSQSTMGSFNEESMITLARIEGLQKLNFSNITPQDRNNAELFYLSEIGKELAAMESNQEATVLSKHKRYKNLCELHGPPAVARKGKAEINPAFLEARLIKFTFYVPANPDNHEKEVELVKEIPKTFNIYRVKGIVGRFLERSPMSLRLIWETGEWDPVAGFEDVDEFSSDEDDVAEEQTKGGALGNQNESGDAQVDEQAGRFMKREVELEDTTKDVGLLIGEMEARVRVEFRRGRG